MFAEMLDVLIPTYERPYALALTLLSLYNQTFENFNVIISDQSHASVESVAEVQTPIRLLRSRGANVQIHRHLPRQGIAEQRDFLLSLSTGEYCLCLDDDIIMEKDLMARLVDVLREENCGFVGSAPIGLSWVGDHRPHEERIEFIDSHVEPETVLPGTRAWQRHKLHNAANLWHLQQKLQVSPVEKKKYRVAWVGACVLYDAKKLRAVGGFGFWRDLPHDHCGEDVLVQLRLLERFGGCAVFPSGAYHQELKTTIECRDVNAVSFYRPSEMRRSI